MELDWSGIPEDKPGAGKKTEFELIPEDTRVEARLIGLKPGKTQNGKNFYEAEFLIIEGEFTNRHVWTRLYTDKGANFKMRDLLQATGVYKATDNKKQNFEVHDVLQKQVTLVMGVNRYNPEKPRNEAKYINRSNSAKNETVGVSSAAGATGGGGFAL